MAADQIFILGLLLACVIAVGWMSVHSHRADANRPKPPAPSPEPDASRDRSHGTKQSRTS